MKINYSLSSATKNKPKSLFGIRKTTDSLITHSAQQAKSQKNSLKNVGTNSKKYSWKRVISTSILGFLLLIVASYFLRFSLTVSTVDMILGLSVKASTLRYSTQAVSFDNAIPQLLVAGIQEKLGNIEHNGTKRFRFDTSENATQLYYTATPATDETILTSSFLVPVGHLYWVRDTVAKGNLETDQIFVKEGYKAAYEKILVSYLGKTPKLTETKDLAASLKGQENSIALVDANELNGAFKVLLLDGNFFLDKNEKGAIKYSLVAKGSSKVVKDIIMTRASEIIPKPFDATTIATLNMTGVTAITRGLGIKTAASKNGAYAAEKIGDFLASADLTHVSNEISFADNCVPKASTMAFCTKNDAIEALKKSGVDIVELTGNHNNDYGSTWNTSTINKYKALGWDYFGGGLNAGDASKILYKTVKGTKLAFLGYNYYDSTVGSPGALANASRSGANSWSSAKVANDIKEARKNADVVIVDFQYQECWSYTDNYSVKESCYSPLSVPDQKKDFRWAIDNGADIVVGTQAHQPQTYEVYNGKVIYYGLGNLFFDQVQWLSTRQGLVLTHYFYNGKFMGTKITTTIYDSDMKTYVTTGNARTTLLNSLKKMRNF